ncbi:hypothetical protein [Paracidovorax wautersii]|uniref:Uncharacterized protein n=1 Tax=Paracidovorax wautersii TaxID=1177982 RepID=A0A1I2E6K4_9BURK|nr:hypothetical protein [Paracidovorax wautersii]SFE88121.1 hypothetical protein SAMN04489711_106243 [Paracidovorax wautersii]
MNTTTAPGDLPEALRCAQWLEHIANGGEVVSIDALARTSAAEVRSLHAALERLTAWAQTQAGGIHFSGDHPIAQAQEALGTAPPAVARPTAIRHQFIGSPVEIGDAVFRELCLPVIAAASRQPAAKPAQLLQLYSGFICSCLGALAADIGHKRAIEVAQMNVETFSHIDLDAPQTTH